MKEKEEKMLAKMFDAIQLIHEENMDLMQVLARIGKIDKKVSQEYRDVLDARFKQCRDWWK